MNLGPDSVLEKVQGRFKLMTKDSLLSLVLNEFASENLITMAADSRSLGYLLCARTRVSQVVHNVQEPCLVATKRNSCQETSLASRIEVVLLGRGWSA